MTLQQQICGGFGFIPPGTPAFVSTQAQTATANWAAWAFIPQAAVALSAFRFFCVTKNGTGGTLSCKVYGDSAGAPNVAGGVLDTLTVGSTASNSFVNCTGGSVTLTAGTQYWAIISNSDGSPATNNLTIGNAGSNAFPPYSSCDTATSTNSGTSWSSQRNSGGARFDYSDSTYWGTPLNAGSGTGVVGSTQGTYGTKEIGTMFTTPANVQLNTLGAAMYWQPVGTPTGGVFYKLYDATHTLLAQSQSLANGESKTQQVWKQRLWVPSTASVGSNGIYTLQPSTTYTLTMAETTQSDTSSNKFRPYGCLWDTDSHSTPLIPWSMQMDQYDGSAWAQTAGTFFPFALQLGTGAEYTSSGGGGIPNISKIVQNIGTY